MKKNIFIKTSILVLLTCFSLGTSAQICKKKYKTKEVQILQEGNIITTEVIYSSKKTIKSDCKECMYAWLSKEKLVENQGSFVDNPLHGKYIERTLDNQMLTKGTYKYGLKNGLWYYWDSKGLLLFTQEWSNGQKNGQKTVYENSQVIEKNQYKDDTLHGRSIIYLDKGVKLVNTYKNGTWKSVDTLGVPKQKKKCFPFSCKKSEDTKAYGKTSSEKGHKHTCKERCKVICDKIKGVFVKIKATKE